MTDKTPSRKQCVEPCNSKKMGEYDMLRCVAEIGHAGPHCYVVDKSRLLVARREPTRFRIAGLEAELSALKLREERGRELLGLLYDKWENGNPCYQDADEDNDSLGNAFKLTDEEESSVLAHLATGGGGEGT